MAHDTVTMTDIATLAGVKRPTVSNWRRRHEDFPEAVDVSGTQPCFDAEEVAQWLDRRPLLDEPEVSYGDLFRTALAKRGLGSKWGPFTGDELVRLSVSMAAERASAGVPLHTTVAQDFRPLAQMVDALVESIGPARAVERLIATADRGSSALWSEQTPDAIADLIARLVGDVTGSVVVDPAVGTGNLLLRVLGGRQPKSVTAIDRDLVARTMLGHRLTCHGVAADILGQDSLPDMPVEPADVIVADPPFLSSERAADHDGPLAWVHAASRALAPGGRAYVVVPVWMLSRGGQVAQLLAMRSLAAVIQLPRRAHAFRTGTELAVLELTPFGEGPDEITLCDANELPEASWIEQAVSEVRAPARPEVCRVVPAAALRLLLPALVLAPETDPVNHASEALVASRDLARIVGPEHPWIKALGKVRQGDAVTHRRLGEVADIRPGHRIDPRYAGDHGSPLIGAEELKGERPPGSRRIDLVEFARQYPNAEVTKAGDVLVLADQDVWTMVDAHGVSVAMYPVQIVRPSKDVPPRVLAALLKAPRNVRKGSGGIVWRAALREVELPLLTLDDMGRLDKLLAELDRRRERLRAELKALDRFADVVAAGVADGVLRVDE